MTKVAAVGLLALTLSAAMVLVVTPDGNEARDFFRDYWSARNLLSGKPVYGSLEQSLYDYLGPLPALGAVYNGHPPTSVLLAVPFAWTDYVHATMLWGWASLILLGVSLAMILSELKCNLSIEQSMLLLVALTVWPPLWFHIGYGQFGLVLLFLMTLAWRAARSGSDGYAGSIIGLAIAIKIFPAVLLLYFALRRRWRAVVFGIVSCIIVNGMTLAVVGTRTYRDYFAVGLPHLAGFYAHARNSSLTGFFSHLCSPPLARTMILVSSAVILAMMGRAATRKPTDFDGEFALTVSGTLLLSALTWEHSFVLLLLPLAICAVRFPHVEAGPRYLLIGSWLLMAVPEPFLPGFSDSGTPSTIQSLGVLSVNFYGLLACFIAQTRFHAAPGVQTGDQVHVRGLP